MAFSTKAVEFGGTNEYVTMGNVLGFEYTSPRSFSLWFNTVSQGYGWLLSKHGDTPAYQGFGIYQLNTGELLVVLRSDNATSNFLQVTTTAKFNDGKRHHLLVAWDGNATPGAGGVSIWVDTVLQAVTVNQDTLTATILNSHPFNLGARTNISGFWVGMMDEVAVYSAELSASDATWLYNGGESRDLMGAGAPSDLVAWWRMGEGDTYPTLSDSTVLGTWPTIPDLVGSYDGTATNMELADIVSDTPGGVSSRSLYFGGTDEYVTMGNVLDFATADPFTLSCWVKYTGQNWVPFVAKRVTGGWNGYLMTCSGSSYIAILRDGGGNYAQVATTGINPADNNWHHLVLSYDGSGTRAGMRLYMDGTEPGRSDGGSSSFGEISNSADFTIAGDGYSKLVGGVDEVTVYDKALSLAEAQWIYNSGAPRDPRDVGAPSNLVAYWSMGEGVGGGSPGTMTNMEAADIRSLESSEQFTATPTVVFLDEDGHEQFPAIGSGGPSPGPTKKYKMRGRDDGVPAPGYVTWIATGTPDFAGVGFPTGTPTPVGNLVINSVIVEDEWEE